MKTNNAVVLVTGANRGLGRALVREVLDRGAKRVYAGARDIASLGEVVKMAPDRVIGLSVDINDATSLEAAAKRASDITVLVNNAGVLSSYGVLSTTVEQMHQDFATNVFGTLAATKAFLPALERAATSGEAAVVNVLSVVSLASMPGLGGYAAAKAAAYSVTQSLRGELARKNIAVHAALPGAIDTDMIRTFEMTKTSPEAVAKGIIDGLEQGLDEILPDPMSRDLFAMWKRDPKELERALAAM